MQRDIPYGKELLRLFLPECTEELKISEPEPRLTPENFTDLLVKYLAANPADLDDTIVVIADKTRVCDYPTYLPLLAKTLQQRGMKKESLRFIIAYGTHPRQSDDECIKCYGDIYRRYPFIHHDCDDEKLFIDLGTTKRGTPIRCRKDIHQASCVITMGPICHHYFAGYGGGRKLIFPGCGEKKAIYANHGLYLNRKENRLQSACQPGQLHQNPIAEDLFEIENACPADIAIHGIMNSHGRLCEILIGSSRNVFLEACSLHGSLCESEAAVFPLVVASCGGFPKDINFIQSHKAIHNSSMFVEDGGTLVIYSQCPDGIGSKTFLPWFENTNFAGSFTALSCNYQGNGGTALAMMSKTRRIQIIMVTDLDDELCTKIGVEKWSHNQVTDHLHNLDLSVGYIPNGSLLVKKASS